MFWYNAGGRWGAAEVGMWWLKCQCATKISKDDITDNEVELVATHSLIFYPPLI